MPNSSSSIIIASSQATLEEAIKHDIVNDLGEVVFDSRHDWLAASWTPSTIGQASTCRPTNATASRAGHATTECALAAECSTSTTSTQRPPG